jgi:steroid delta-isomerase-like uncharacterized protein
VLDEWLASWSAHDIGRIQALFADAMEHRDIPVGAVNLSKDELRAFAEARFAVSPVISFEATAKIVTGTRAAVEWVSRGTHQGDLPGMPAAGKPWEVRGISVVELEDGKITRCRDYWDFATVMRELGFLPEHAVAGG